MKISCSGERMCEKLEAYKKLVWKKSNLYGLKSFVRRVLKQNGGMLKKDHDKAKITVFKSYVYTLNPKSLLISR